MSEQKLTAWAKFGSVELKRKFAALLRERPDNDSGRFEAACILFPDQEDTQLCLRIIQEWPRDPIVMTALAELAKAEKADELPSREQQARDIYKLAADNTKGVDDRLKAHKLYADLMGFVQKPGAAAANVFIDNRRVMLMPAPANSVDDWEKQATSHQSGLVIDAASTLSNRK